MSSSSLTHSIISRQDSTTTSALISHLSSSKSFHELSEYEGHLIALRDKEDDEKLQDGIDYAISKGVLEPITPETYTDIYVDGKTPEEVSNEILGHVGTPSGSFVLVLCGLSGTGKGTTVSTLRKSLEEERKRSVCCWSNGNIFRSVSLLASSFCTQNNVSSVEDALTKENIAEWMSMLHFEKLDGGNWDTVIRGMGYNDNVLSIQNTVLKYPKVSKILPTVAKETQGEVVRFASDAIATMVSETQDMVVLLEGRMQTVNYVKSQYRFVLKLMDESVVGQRRAAQRIMGSVVEQIDESSSSEKIDDVVHNELDTLVKDIESQ